jgi:hypothetical protein
MMKGGKRQSAKLVMIASFMLMARTSSAQSTGTLLSFSGGRPMANAVAEIVELSSIPVNYEDVRSESTSDTKDVTDAVMTPEQRALGGSSVRLLVPSGGTFSANVLIDAATGRLPDTSSVLSALNALAAAYSSTNLPGKFEVETYNGVFFVHPSEYRDVSGGSVPALPVMKTPISVSGQTRSAAEVLKLIIDQVSERIGIEIKIGSIPIGAFARSQVSISAQNEPANRIVSRLMASVSTYGMAPGDSGRGMSYRLLYDPQLKYYVFNAHAVQAQSSSRPARDLAPARKGDSPYMIKAD